MELSKNPETTVEGLEQETKDILTTMMAKMNIPTLRFVAYGFRKIWQRLYRQVPLPLFTHLSPPLILVFWSLGSGMAREPPFSRFI